jgi:hypothetical protein
MALYKNEENDLGLHVSVCQERYQQLDARLTKLELKFDDLIKKIDDFKTEFTWLLVKLCAGMFVSIVGGGSVVFKLVG